MTQLILYGVVGEDFDARSVAKELAGGGDLEVRINSAGGDVFDGLAIYNILKRHKGTVDVYIEGIAASAASLIMCAGDNVYMAANGVIMVHQAAVGLAGYYEAGELDKVSSMLATLKESILTTYEARTRQPRAKLEEMVDAETWLDAVEAKALGFVDEIIESVEAEYDAAAKVMYVNSLSVKLGCKELTDKVLAAVKPVAVEMKEMEKQAEVEQMLVESALKERGRIRELLAQKCENAAVNAVLDLAIEDGKTLEEVGRYVEAVKRAPAVPVEVPSVEQAAVERICAMVRDNMTSGAQEVEVSPPEAQVVDKQKSQSEMLARLVNQKLKGVAVR